MFVEVKAPNRIDLAGGTTDLYPVYLFMDGGFTVNASISVMSKVALRLLDDPVIIIESTDLGSSAVLQLNQDLDTQGPLALIIKALKAFPPECGLHITTENEAPPGSGLGASSALIVSLVLGLAKIKQYSWSNTQIIHYAADVETSLIGVPAGKQDHIAALYGGVSFLNFGYTGFIHSKCNRPEHAKKALEEMIILSYTGEGRFSGMNNWDITRSVIEKTGDIKAKLLEIREVAKRLARAVDAGAWIEVAGLIDQEWKIRRSLAPGVSTPVVDAIMNAAKTSGALASKICGAGGGGCMITMVEPQDRSRIEAAISEAGGTVIPFSIVEAGATVTVSE